MAPRSQLTLPGLAVLIAVALLVTYLERSSEDGGRTPTTAAPRSQSEPARARPDDRKASSESGAFDYYALALSWSPTHCETPEGRDDHAQCAPRNGRLYSFVLHGLWPQYERGYPEACRTKSRPFVPEKTIDDMMSIMPGRGLIIHQYRKHGTCSGLEPEPYFRLARRLHDSIVVPPQFRQPVQEQFVDPRDVIQAFVRSNPQLKPDMIAVSCGGPGSRLKEVRICFSKSGVPQSCGRNEEQNRLCRTSRMHVPPVRAAQ